MSARIYLLAALIPMLAGCATEEQARSTAYSEAVNHCAAEGRQFVYDRTDKTPAGLITNVSVSGYCVAK